MISFIVPFRSDGSEERDRSFKYVYDSLALHWPDEEIIVSDSEEGPFNRAQARNFGARQAHGNTLVFVDADSFVPHNQMLQAVGYVEQRQWGWALPYTTYYSLTKAGTEKFYNEMVIGPEDCLWVFPGPDPWARPAAVGGGVVVPWESYEAVNGYDERFVGWGWEDASFALALDTLAGGRFRAEGPLYHLWHPTVEQDQFNHPHLEHNRALFNEYQRVNGRRDDMRALVCGH